MADRHGYVGNPGDGYDYYEEGPDEIGAPFWLWLAFVAALVAYAIFTEWK